MTLYVLDTDMATLLLRGQPAVCSRAAEHDPSELAITIITVEEILTGWYTQIRRAKKDDQLERAYEALHQAVEFVARVRILGFGKEAIKRFRTLRSSHPRLGANDLKIAAIVKSHDGTIVTRNRSDFSPVPGLQIEDWVSCMAARPRRVWWRWRKFLLAEYPKEHALRQDDCIVGGGGFRKDRAGRRDPNRASAAWFEKQIANLSNAIFDTTNTAV